MASTRETPPADPSISSTAQITKAMQMVAASKMRKAQQAAIDVRPFIRLLYRIQRQAATRAIDFKHPLLEVRPVKKRAVILVASDKGLCGALNSNLFRLAGRYDPNVDRLHHGRAQGGAVRRPHAAAAASPSFPTATRRDSPRRGRSRRWPAISS